VDRKRIDKGKAVPLKPFSMRQLLGIFGMVVNRRPPVGKGYQREDAAVNDAGSFSSLDYFSPEIQRRSKRSVSPTTSGGRRESPASSRLTLAGYPEEASFN
jgi:hypothetical protein